MVQTAAVTDSAGEMCIRDRISIITGGPGTGKTTVLKVILYIHQALCRSEVQLMAPTGRAARRMAVSYTHLDVYKRQVYYYIKF